MGKSYTKELSRLSDTYAWAIETPIESLVTAISASSQFPLLAVGSGGSFSAAHIASSLHQHHTGMVSKPVTPLELVSSSIRLRSLSTIILSAGGSNADIISAFENVISREPKRCVVLCLRKGSSLSRLASSYQFVDVPDLNPPSIKDGFLATNSLLAFAVLLVRAYSSAFASNENLPRNFNSLLENAQSNRDYIEDLRARCDLLWNCETLVVLYGPSVAAAALDLESKFSEAALGNIQLADFRNFAHGRHHWLAKRASKTGVLAICANDEQVLCEKTLQLIPHSIPIARISLSNVGMAANVAALVTILHLVAAAGERHGIDPGRPGVPIFGRRIYRLRALRALNKTPSQGQLAIARKLGCDIQELQDRQDLPFWHDSYQRFVSRLTEATFGAVLFDYDGTLCDERDRFLGPREDAAQELTHLLQAGIVLGIATGRGDSVRTDLRKVLPKHLWKNVHIGYHNGSNLGRLSDDDPLNSSETLSDSLKPVLEAISVHPLISRLAKYKASQDQVSIRPSSSADVDLIWRLVQHIAQNHELTALKSSHSIDVLLPGVSKRSLLNWISGLLEEKCEILSIGDKGQWPGNDFDLLNTPYSLSVDEVSADPDTCWNIAPSGYRGVQATLEYLHWLSAFSPGRLHLSIKNGGRR